MRVSLIQCKPSGGGHEATLRSIESVIGSGTGADIYILPEMFATGQSLEPACIAQTMDGPVVSWMRQMAVRLDAAVAGSVAISENGHYYNRFCMARPDGVVDVYDKRHLFSYSGENLRFSAGKERVVVEFRGLRILLQVCYDLRFPVFSRNRDDYDMAIYVANWPLKRQSSWDILLRARAMENQCFVAGVNRVGDDEYGHYEGHSVLLSPYGEALAAADNDAVRMVTGDLDMEHLRHFRAKFPVLDDADPVQ